MSVSGDDCTSSEDVCTLFASHWNELAGVLRDTPSGDIRLNGKRPSRSPRYRNLSAMAWRGSWRGLGYATRTRLPSGSRPSTKLTPLAL